MHKIYFKQAWQMLKEDKTFSIIAVLGTVLAITMTMVVILTQEIKTKNIAPEVNRERTMIIQYSKEASSNFTSLSPVSIKFYKQFLNQLKAPEAVSLIRRTQRDICLEGSHEYLQTDVKYTDPSFWNICRFSFVEGKPFSKEEFQSGIPVAVISKVVAQKLFKGEPVLGKMFVMNNKTYKVIGLVEDVSAIFNNAYAQVWVPYTSDFHRSDENACEYNVLLLAKNKNDFKSIKAEVRQSEKRNNPEISETKVSFFGPLSQTEQFATNGVNEDFNDPDVSKGKWKFFLALAILLLIPAINLSGFSLFKIINRTSEIGIRKAFGANRKTILMQVLYENMLTSMIGGVIGLVLSFVAVTLVKDRLFTMNTWDSVVGEHTVPISAFFSPSIFFYVFLACIVLNLLSAGIPAWRASRLDIVNAIKN